MRAASSFKSVSCWVNRSLVGVGSSSKAVATKGLFSPKTFQSYAEALRKIAGDITGVAGREKRDAIKLRTITPEKIEAWRVEFIRRKATDPCGRRAPGFRWAASS